MTNNNNVTNAHPNSESFVSTASGSSSSSSSSSSNESLYEILKRLQPVDQSIGSLYSSTRGGQRTEISIFLDNLDSDDGGMSQEDGVLGKIIKKLHNKSLLTFDFAENILGIYKLVSESVSNTNDPGILECIWNIFDACEKYLDIAIVRRVVYCGNFGKVVHGAVDQDALKALSFLRPLARYLSEINKFYNDVKVLQQVAGVAITAMEKLITQKIFEVNLYGTLLSALGKYSNTGQVPSEEDIANILTVADILQKNGFEQAYQSFESGLKTFSDIRSWNRIKFVSAFIAHFVSNGLLTITAHGSVISYLVDLQNIQTLWPLLRYIEKNHLPSGNQWINVAKDFPFFCAVINFIGNNKAQLTPDNIDICSHAMIGLYEQKFLVSQQNNSSSSSSSSGFGSVLKSSYEVKLVKKSQSIPENICDFGSITDAQNAQCLIPLFKYINETQSLPDDFGNFLQSVVNFVATKRAAMGNNQAGIFVGSMLKLYQWKLLHTELYPILTSKESFQCLLPILEHINSLPFYVQGVGELLQRTTSFVEANRNAIGDDLSKLAVRVTVKLSGKMSSNLVLPNNAAVITCLMPILKYIDETNKWLTTDLLNGLLGAISFIVTNSAHIGNGRATAFGNTVLKLLDSGRLDAVLTIGNLEKNYNNLVPFFDCINSTNQFSKEFDDIVYVVKLFIAEKQLARNPLLQLVVKVMSSGGNSASLATAIRTLYEKKLLSSNAGEIVRSLLFDKEFRRKVLKFLKPENSVKALAKAKDFLDAMELLRKPGILGIAEERRIQQVRFIKQNADVFSRFFTSCEFQDARVALERITLGAISVYVGKKEKLIKANDTTEWASSRGFTALGKYNAATDLQKLFMADREAVSVLRSSLFSPTKKIRREALSQGTLGGMAKPFMSYFHAQEDKHKKRSILMAFIDAFKKDCKADPNFLGKIFLCEPATENSANVTIIRTASSNNEPDLLFKDARRGGMNVLGVDFSVVDKLVDGLPKDPGARDILAKIFGLLSIRVEQNVYEQYVTRITAAKKTDDVLRIAFDMFLHSQLKDVDKIAALKAGYDQQLALFSAVTRSHRLQRKISADIVTNIAELEAPPPVISIFHTADGSVRVTCIETGFSLKNPTNYNKYPIPGKIKTAYKLNVEKKSFEVKNMEMSGCETDGTLGKLLFGQNVMKNIDYLFKNGKTLASVEANAVQNLFIL